MQGEARRSLLRVLVPEMPGSRQLLPYLEMIDQAQTYTNFGPLETKLRGPLARLIDAEDPPELVTLANATLGLEMMLDSFALPPGSLVCIPAFTFVATASAILRVGLKVAVADVDPESWLLTPRIARAVLARQRVAAFLPVSTFGNPVNEAEWDAFAQETGCPVLIDAAAAVGSQKPGRHCAAVYSLHATKALGAGEGGAVATRDAQAAKRLRDRCNFGIDLERPDRMVTTAVGTNAKLSEYHAAVALAALDTWNSRTKWRHALYERYAQALHELGASLALQALQGRVVHNYMNLRLSEGSDVAAVRAALDAQAIETRRWYLPLVHHHPAFSDAFVAGPLDESERLARCLVSLPFHASVSHADVDRVVAALAPALARA